MFLRRFGVRRDALVLEPLTIHYNPPLDGSYPPRLINPLSSIWIANDDPLVLDGLFSVQHSGGVTTLIATDNGAKKLRVNGQPFNQQHILQDGDFIQRGHQTFIFQSDPVADRKRRMLAMLERQPLMVSQRLREHIDLNETGLSLDNRRTYIAWDKIITMQFSFGNILPGFPWRVYIAVYHTDAEKATRLFLTLKKRDLFALIDWFRLVVPFDISVFDPQHPYGGSIRTLLPDAYYAAIVEKIFEPAKEGKRTLPANSDVIWGFASFSRGVLIVFCGCLGIGALLVVVGIATGDDLLRILGLIIAGLFAFALWRLHKERLEQR